MLRRKEAFVESSMFYTIQKKLAMKAEPTGNLDNQGKYFIKRKEVQGKMRIRASKS